MNLARMLDHRYVCVGALSHFATTTVHGGLPGTGRWLDASVAAPGAGQLNTDPAKREHEHESKPTSVWRRRAEVPLVALALLAFVWLVMAAAAGNRIAQVLAASALWFWLVRRWLESRKGRAASRARHDRIESMLGARTRAQVLASSPYTTGRWPDGDDCWVIHDSRTDQIVVSVSGQQEAELWILERTLGEESQRALTD